MLMRIPGSSGLYPPGNLTVSVGTAVPVPVPVILRLTQTG